MNLAYSLSFWAKYAYVDSAVLHTALRLRLLDHLIAPEHEPVTIGKLAEQLQASLHGVRVLVEPLVGTGVLVQDARGGLTLEPRHAGLLRDPAYVERLRAASGWWRPSLHLTDALRGNGDHRAEGQDENLIDYYRRLFLDQPPTGDDLAGQLFDRVARQFLRTQALNSAGDLGIIERCVNGPVELSELGAAAEIEPERLRVLVETLVGMGVMERAGTAYALVPSAQQILNPRTLSAYTQSLRLSTMFWDALDQLDIAVVHDRRVLDLQEPGQSSRFYYELARYNTMIFPSYLRLSRSLAATLAQVRPPAGTAVLDVGAGSGAWGAAFAMQEPGATVTFVDREQVLAQTKRNAERLKIAGQARFLPGDLYEVDYGEAAYDTIILGQICHTQPPHELPRLLGLLERALRPGGHLIICDFVLNDQRDAPLDYLYFAVKEFTSTQGDVLSLREYTDLLDLVGLRSSRCYKLPGIEVMIASRGDAALPDELAQAPRLSGEPSASSS